MTDEQIISELLSNLSLREAILQQNVIELQQRDESLTQRELWLQTTEQHLNDRESSVSERESLLLGIERSLKSYSAAVEGELLFWKVMAGLAVLVGGALAIIF